MGSGPEFFGFLRFPSSLRVLRCENARVLAGNGCDLAFALG